MASEPDHNTDNLIFGQATTHVAIGVACCLVLGLVAGFALGVPILVIPGILVGAIAGMTVYGLTL